MSVKAQAVYMSLAKNNIPGLDDIRAIRATNGFAIQFPSSQEGSGAIAAMVFPKIARLNHSWYVRFVDGASTVEIFPV